MLRIESFAVTDVGCKRDHNEDYYGIDDAFELFVVADGMGGHASGEVASRLAVENLMEFFTTSCRVDGFRWPYPPESKATTFEEIALSNAIQYANDRVFIESMKDRRYDDMGTTLVAVAGAGESLVIAHVGDSRAYRYRNGQIAQITEDHSLLNHYIRTRGMTEEEIKAFKSKNVIVRAVGLKDYVEPDVQRTDKSRGDIWLLCSDGLSDLVDDWIIQEVIAGNEDDLEAMGHALVRIANQNGGKDNITVMLLRVVGDAPSDARATRPMRADFEVEELDTSDFLFEDGGIVAERTQPHPMSLVDTGPMRAAAGATPAAAQTAKAAKAAQAAQAATPAEAPAPAAAATGRVGAGQRIGVTVSSGEVDVPSKGKPKEPLPEVRLRDTQPVPVIDPSVDVSGDAETPRAPAYEAPEEVTLPSITAMKEPEAEPPAPLVSRPATPVTHLPDEELQALLAAARPAPLPRG